MSERAWPWIGLWAGFLAVLTGLMAIFGDIDPVSPLLLGGAAAGTLALAGLAAWRDRSPARRSAAGGRSPGTVVAAVGVTLMVGGAEVGLWMLAIGAGLLVAGAAGLVAERRA
jgi:hypothetical protein